jgi:hypothetical protein
MYQQRRRKELNGGSMYMGRKLLRKQLVRAIFTSNMDLEMKKLVKCYIWNIA